MKADEIQRLELFSQGLDIIRREFNLKFQELQEELEKLMPEEPLHDARDCSAELDEIYREKCRGKS